MEYYKKLQHLMLDIYLIDQLLNHKTEGIGRLEFSKCWENFCVSNNFKYALSRATFNRHIDNIKELGLNISCDNHNKYRLLNARIIKDNPILKKMMDSLREWSFLDAYRTLGGAIQPQPIANGRDNLIPLANAIKNKKKVCVTYSPFGREEYDAIMHPYALKESQQRWYLLAYKEGNTHHSKAQTFALDRIKNVGILSEEFDIPEDIDPNTYFENAYGIWVTGLQAEKISLLASRLISEYLITLPLHETQSTPIPQSDGRYLFTLNLSPTPDFVNALLAFGAEIEVVSPQTLRQTVAQRLHEAAKIYERK